MREYITILFSGEVFLLMKHQNDNFDRVYEIWAKYSLELWIQDDSVNEGLAEWEEMFSDEWKVGDVAYGRLHSKQCEYDEYGLRMQSMDDQVVYA